MATLPPKARYFMLMICAGAFVTLCVSIPRIIQTPKALAFLPLWALIYALADYFEVEFEYEENSKVITTISEAILVFLVAVSGLAALPAIIVGSLIADLLHRRIWYHSLFNIADRVITYTVTWCLYATITPPGSLPFTGPIGLFALGAILVTFYTMNSLLVSTIMALTLNQPILLVLRQAFLQLDRTQFLTLPLGALLATLWYVDHWIVLVGIVPLIIAQRSFAAVANWQAASRRNTRLARQIEQLQDVTTAMVTSLNPHVVLKTISVRLADHLQAAASWVVLWENNQAQIASDHGNLPEWAPLLAEHLATQRLDRILDYNKLQLAHFAKEVGGIFVPEELIAIPMKLEERVLGAICLVFDKPSLLLEPERRVLHAFATQAALVIEHANLFEALQHKQRELVRSSKLAALGTFSAGIAHEFNNILAGILGFAQLGQISDDREEQQEALAIIEQSCVRGRNITAGLLAFSRRGPSQRRLSHVREAVESALQLVERELAKHNITVERHFAPVPPTVCDSDQITQVVLNLLTNARDAIGDQSGGTIRIELRQHGSMIELAVHDSGVGIPEELLDQIFQPFMTTKGALGGSSTPGTGLGLAISYGIIESHNGTINVTSKPGTGSTFTIHLPILQESDQVAPPTFVQPRPTGLRILLVDDDTQVLSSLSALLMQYHHYVKVAPNGSAALHAFRTEPFDLVVCDALMPGMDGPTLMRRLHEVSANVPIIAMSGHMESAQLAHMLQLHAHGPLIKPFTIEELLTTIAPISEPLLTLIGPKTTESVA